MGTAKNKGRRLSDLMERYLRPQRKDEKKGDTQLSPEVSSLMGSLKLPGDLDYKKVLTDALSEEYLQ